MESENTTYLNDMALVSAAAAQMKAAHEAAAYDKWFRAQVQEAIDDPRPAIPHEQVKAEWALERAALLKQIEQAA